MTRHRSPPSPLPRGLSLERVMDAAQDDECLGFCLECGAEQDGVEPDAEGYPCEICGAEAVTGAEQILLLEFVR